MIAKDERRVSYFTQVAAEAGVAGLDVTNMREWEEGDFRLFSIVLDNVEQKVVESKSAILSKRFAERKSDLSDCLKNSADVNYLDVDEVNTFALVKDALFGEPFHGDLLPAEQDLLFTFFNKVLNSVVREKKEAAAAPRSKI